ncbi:vesicle-associated protein 1-1 [Gracilaria domingensis]|nr:vesicle-associated protein 1-1 [Gracilaria domingensis]
MLNVVEAPKLADAERVKHFWAQRKHDDSVRSIKFKVHFLLRQSSPQLSDSPCITSLPKNISAGLSNDTQDMTGIRVFDPISVTDNGGDHETAPRRCLTMGIVDIDKRMLSFLIGAPGTVSSDALTVRNRTCEPVAFKMKTNSPRHYIVRPSIGFIQPHASFEVFVGTRLNSDQTLPGPSRDKFLLQVIKAPGLLDADLTKELWAHHKNRNVEAIKLPVQFVNQACVEDGEEKLPMPQSGSNAKGLLFSDSDTSSDW